MRQRTTGNISLAFKALAQLGPRPLALYALYRLGVKSGYFRRLERKVLATTDHLFSTALADLTLTPLFPLPSRRALFDTLGDEGRRALLAEADRIVAGEYRPFGGDYAPLVFNAPEQEGHRPHHWTTCEAHLHLLNLPHSDIKFLWEPARFTWAFTLGRAYHVSGEPRYAAAFWRYFEQFTQANLPYLGPHWMNGQEVALRLIALVWADRVFGAAKVSTPERRARLARAVAEHAARLPHTLLYARSQENNHLLSEAAALYTASLALPTHPEAPRWRALGWTWLNRALRRQINDYGEYIQHSTNYHRLMLQLALWVDLLLREEGRPWPALTSRALARASHWLLSMLDPVSGRTPNLGANDGAYLLPLSVSSFRDYRPVAQAAARAFLRFQIPSGPWDELSLWLALPTYARTHEATHYLGENLRARHSWAYLRASRFKSRLGHMDQLHLDLWWRGLNIAQDAGTYLYNAPPPWDNALTTTLVHNTVTVDGRDQMTRAGRFLTLDWVTAYSKPLLDEGSGVLQGVRAYHDGYRRLGVRHERTVTVFADERWQVLDTLRVTRRGPVHAFRLHWLLPDWEWQIEATAGSLRLRLKSPYGWVGVRVFPRPVPFCLSLARAGELLYGEGEVPPTRGWVSPTYGVKEPALSLAVEARSADSVQFITEFIFPTP